MQRLSAPHTPCAPSSSGWKFASQQRPAAALVPHRGNGLFGSPTPGTRLPTGQRQLHSCAAAAPSAAACTTSKSSRKALKHLFKQHRKRLEDATLEDATSSLTRSAPNSSSLACSASTAVQPVLTDLVTQLKALSLQLERSPGLERYLPDDGSGVDCTTRSVSAAGTSAASTLAVAGRSIAVPQLDYDEEAFSAMHFSGSGRVLVCQGSKCRALGAGQVLAAVSALGANSPGIEIVPCKCLGKCKEGPALRVRPEAQACSLYTRVEPARLPEVWSSHFSAPPAPACDATNPECCVECGQDGHVHAAA